MLRQQRSMIADESLNLRSLRFQGGKEQGSLKVNDYDGICSVYDSSMGREFTNRLYPWIFRNMSTIQCGSDRLRMLDLACGTGELIRLVADDIEVDAHGIDISRGQIGVARKKFQATSNSIKFQTADITKVPFPRSFDIVTMTFDALNHILQPADWQRIFEKVWQSLKQNGIFMFDVNTTRRLASDWGEAEIVVKPGLLYLQLPHQLERDGRLVRRSIDMFVYTKSGSAYSCSRAAVRQLAVPLGEVEQLLRKSGFSCVSHKSAEEALHSTHIFLDNRQLFLVRKG